MNKYMSWVVLWLPFFAGAQPAIDKAAGFYQAKHWPEAREAYREVTTTNPFRGEYWFRYGEACLETGDPGEALRGFREALATGLNGPQLSYRMAGAYTAMGDTDKAVQWLQTGLQEGLDLQALKSDPRFEVLHENPRFRELVTEPPRLADRDARWLADLDFLVREVKQRHYDPTHTISEEAWDRDVDTLRARIPAMKDLEVIGAMMKLLARIGDGHTQLYPPFRGPLAFRFLPLEFYFFREGLFIRGASAEYAGMVGSRVLKMGSMEVTEAVKACSQFLGHDNEMQLQWILPVAMAFSDMYPLIGASGQTEALSLTLEKPGGDVETVVVQAGEVSRDPMARFVPPHWADLKGGNQNLWTSDPDNFYWYEYLPEEKWVYCQWNQVRDKPEMSLADFSRELFAFVESHEVNALVLDLRLNNGGNNFLNRGFIHELIRCTKINRHGRLFAIIGRRTFSAAMNLVSELENESDVLFVGEPTGSRPNFYGEESGFVLPYSGLTGSISTRYWQGGATSDDHRKWVAPHLAAPLSAEAYRRGQDPALEAIRAYLEVH